MSRARLTICLAAVLAAALLVAVPTPAADASKGAPIVVHVEHGGFRWTDAGIGALVGAGLALTGVGCTAVVRSRDAGETSSRKARKS